MTTTNLIHALNEVPTSAAVLFLADENIDINQCVNLKRFSKLSFQTNRYDIFLSAQKILKAHCEVAFSDFDIEPLEDCSFDVIAYRVSKERSVSHWVLNQGARLLKHGGTLLLSGKKDEGIKTYSDKCIKQLGFVGRLEKHGTSYLARLTAPGSPPNKSLDDKNYTQLRTIGESFSYKVVSKPGQYGWQKFDQGSSLLAEEFSHWLTGKTAGEALDLGCGYGYLSLAMASLGVAHITATDNNAAALLSCEANLAQTPAQITVVAADCGHSIKQQFDLILCNPPFHQGFSVESQLTAKFLESAARLLKPNGTALFVVNAFIPLERLAQINFGNVKTRLNNRSFKVIELSNPQ